MCYQIIAFVPNFAHDTLWNIDLWMGSHWKVLASWIFWENEILLWKPSATRTEIDKRTTSSYATPQSKKPLMMVFVSLLRSTTRTVLVQPARDLFWYPSSEGILIRCGSDLCLPHNWATPAFQVNRNSML